MCPLRRFMWLSMLLLIICVSLCILVTTLSGLLPNHSQLLVEGTYNRLYWVDVSHNLWLLDIEGSSPAWSPDGRFIAYVVHRNNIADINLLNLVSGSVCELTNTPAYDGSPVWSPDGRRIAFVSARDGNYDVYIMNFDGSNVQNITNSNDFNNNPSWSPDGRYIAFESNRSGRGSIYMLNLTTEDPSPQLIFAGDAWAAHPSWSPDGVHIAFEYYINGYADIYIVHIDGSGLRALTDNPQCSSLSPAWSPDGRSVAFITNDPFIRQVFAVDIRDSGFTTAYALTTGGDDKREPAWQP